MAGIVTLTTDFGPRDSYVAQMKGVLLSTSSAPLQLIDLTHEIPAQDIRSGARLLAEATPLFPPGSVHLAVVDPGVGTERRMVAARLAKRWYVLPDNGLLSILLDRYPLEAAYVVDCALVTRIRSETAVGDGLSSDAERSVASHTFHGRDFMAPVAGWLASGGQIDNAALVTEPLVRLEQTKIRIDQSVWSLPVESIDHFGNIITAATREMLTPCLEGDQVSIELSEGERWLCLDLVKTYGLRRPGELVALFDSQDRLEIAEVNGSAAARLQVRSGDVVRIHCQSGE